MISFSLNSSENIKIVATNSWTAAFAQMAGVIPDQLAPSEMQHPPEYDLKPSDVIKIKNADFLIFAGYENLMKTVFQSFNKDEEKLIKIKTSYVPKVLEESVLKIAANSQSVEVAEKNVSQYKNEFEKSINLINESGLYGSEVIVHFHLKSLIEALGFKVIGVFGPTPLEARQIKDMVDLSPDLIIDNYHNPLGKPLAEITKKRRIELKNFPDKNVINKKDTLTLINVLKDNVEIICD